MRYDYALAIRQKLKAMGDMRFATNSGAYDGHQALLPVDDYSGQAQADGAIPGALDLVAIMMVALPEADSYYWSKPIADAVVESSLSLPNTTTLIAGDEQLWSTGWHFFESPIPVPGSSRPMTAMMVTRVAGRSKSDEARSGFYVTSFYIGDDDGGDAGMLLPKHSGVMTDGTSMAAFAESDPASYASDSEMAASNFMFRLFVTMRLWVEQRVAAKERTTIERQQRRLFARQTGHEQRLDVIVLRRAEACDGHNDREPGHVDWSCQWLVKPHWRNQFYPSSGEHRPKLILGYWKGPADKPIKAPGERVFAVTR